MISWKFLSPCTRLASALTGALTLFAVTTLTAAPALKVLIIDGQNNHKWAETTPRLKVILESTGRFTVDVSTTPPAAPKKAKGVETPPLTEEAKQATVKAWAAWRPEFSRYDVVISNYSGEEWPESVEKAFVAYVKQGGGFVSYHAADNAFARWAEYNEMIGLGGWGGRNEKSGPYLRLRDGAWTKAAEPGPCGGHGAREEFIVENFAPGHPIMQGLPARWMHSQDELYHSLRGPANRVEVLGHGLSDRTKENEPLLMALTYGEGRVFHTTLGHYLEALDGLGFQITFTRGTEWAATGKVTIPGPPPGALTETSPAAVRKIVLSDTK